MSGRSMVPFWGVTLRKSNSIVCRVPAAATNVAPIHPVVPLRHPLLQLEGLVSGQRPACRLSLLLTAPSTAPQSAQAHCNHALKPHNPAHHGDGGSSCWGLLLEPGIHQSDRRRLTPAAARLSAGATVPGSVFISSASCEQNQFSVRSR